MRYLTKMEYIQQVNNIISSESREVKSMGFRITFNKEECKGCAICIVSCPKKLLAFDASYINKNGIHPVMIKNNDDCVGCENCALMCPDAIITIEKLENK